MLDELTPGKVALGAAVLSVLMLLLTIRKMRRESPLARNAPLITIAATVLTTGLYVVITGTQVNQTVAIVALLAGVGLGLFEGRATTLSYRGSDLVAQRRGGDVALWGVASILTILLAQTGSPVVHALGVLALVIGLGATIGANLSLWARLSFLRPSPASTGPPLMASSASGEAPRAVEPLPVQTSGALIAAPLPVQPVSTPAVDLAPASDPRTPPRTARFCTNCGSARASEARFCTNCGARFA